MLRAGAALTAPCTDHGGRRTAFFAHRRDMRMRKNGKAQATTLCTLGRVRVVHGAWVCVMY